MMPIRAPLRIVIPGGSGQVGTLLAQHFHARGDEVTVLSRHPKPTPWKTIHWDACTLDKWTQSLEGADVVINLAGRSVNCRYNLLNQQLIRHSRVLTTQLLGEVIANLERPPKLWMNASTATIYRHALDRAMDEETGELGGNEKDLPAKWNFTTDVAKEWEEALHAAPTPFTRKIALRNAIIMSASRGGPFDILLKLVRLGLGGKSGLGNQYISWVHETDYIRAVDFLIEHEEFDGHVNIAAPNPLPNWEFMRDLRSAWGIGFGLPAAGWMLTLGALLMRTETQHILRSHRVIPGRLLAAGFQFQFPSWPEAVRDLVTRFRKLT